MPPRRRHTKTRPASQGQTLLEFTFALPLLLLMVLGVADLGRAAYVSSLISRLSREAAYLATRSSGTTEREVEAMLDTLIDTAPPALDLRRRGCLYVSRLKVDAGGVAELEWPEPVSRCEIFAPPSRLRGRRRLDEAAQREVLEGQTLNPGERVALVEAFYRYDPLTPVAQFGVRFGSNGYLTLGSAATFFLVSRPARP